MGKLKLPNFFIVGAPKAATTSLYSYLGQHPQIYMCPLKEANFFAAELRPENFSAAVRPQVDREMRALERYLRGGTRERRFGGLVSRWDDYVSLYREASNQIAIGEATPCYLWSETAAGNIAARVPHAKIIVILRNPADRAYSQYLHMVTAGAIRGSFRQQLQANLACQQRQFGPHWPLLEFGQYYGQIRRYRDTFPAAQIHICWYEDLQRAPRQLLAELFAYLGVDRDFAVDFSQRLLRPSIPKFEDAAYLLKKWRLWPQLRRLVPQSLEPRLRSLLLRSRASLAMKPEDRAFLIEYYRDDIQQLSGLLGRDLSSWLNPGRADQSPSSTTADSENPGAPA